VVSGLLGAGSMQASELVVESPLVLGEVGALVEPRWTGGVGVVEHIDPADKIGACHAEPVAFRAGHVDPTPTGRHPPKRRDRARLADAGSLAS